MPVKLLIIIFVFTSLSWLYADTIYLKNGRSIEGIIKNEDADIIELEVCAGSVKFKKSEIGRIERGSFEDALQLRQKWEREKTQNQLKMYRQQLEEARQPRKVEFSQDSQNIILDVTLNHRVDAKLVLDTGASIVMLRRHVAEKLGVKLNKATPNMKVRLADGREVNALHIFLENVKVEDVEANNVEATILLDDVGGFADGLLGMSFLRRFNFKVDHKERRLILEKL